MAMDLLALANEHLQQAAAVSSGRSATTLYGGRDHQLRQTLIALHEGVGLAEHASPGEATLQVLVGEIVLWAGEKSWLLRAGEMMTIPDERHSVESPMPSVFMLTVVTAKRDR